MRKVCMFFVVLSLLFSFNTYCFAAPQDTIIGSWEGDIESYLELPFVKEQLDSLESEEEKEGMVLYLALFYRVISAEITKDAITLSIGTEGGTVDYEVAKVTGNNVHINIIEETIEEWILEIVDEDHLIVHEVDGSETTLLFCLKRVQ